MYSKFENSYDYKLAISFSEEPVYMGSFQGDFGERKNALVDARITSEEEFFNLNYSKNICCP